MNSEEKNKKNISNDALELISELSFNIIIGKFRKVGEVQNILLSLRRFNRNKENDAYRVFDEADALIKNSLKKICMKELMKGEDS